MNPLLQKLVTLALQEVGVHEASPNTGPRIREYQATTWLKPGPWPWCAAWCCWLLREWLKNPDVQAALHLADAKAVRQFLCRDPRAFGWEAWARGHKIPVLPETSLAHAGDFVVFEFSHIGLVVADQHLHSDSFESVEGNTNRAGSRDGDGVWRKTRASHLVKSYIRIINAE